MFLKQNKKTLTVKEGIQLNIMMIYHYTHIILANI